MSDFLIDGIEKGKPMPRAQQSSKTLITGTFHGDL